MTQKELIEDSYEENCFDNPTLDENFIKTSIIFVQSKVVENEPRQDSKVDSQDLYVVHHDLPITPRNRIKDPDNESSSDSIEIVNIEKSSSKIRKVIQSPVFQNGSDKEVDQSTTRPNEKILKKKIKVKLKRKNSTNIFEDQHKFWDLIESPNPSINVINPKENLMKFLFSPPPKDVVVKCQLNKTYKKDITMMFSKFIFSLQISDRDDNQKRDILNLMAARSRKKTKTANYIISTDVSEMKSNSSNIIGKMKGNLMGTQFRLYQHKRPLSGTAFNSDENCDSFDNVSDVDSIKQSDIIGVAFYKPISIIKPKPRKIDVVIPYWEEDKGVYCTDVSLPSDKNDLHNHSNSYVLEMIEPNFSKELKCYTLDFGGRAETTSVKNFALKMKVEDKEKRVYQFGKCKDHYIVDYTYPLCAFQAFAISLSSCHRKMAAD